MNGGNLLVWSLQIGALVVVAAIAAAVLRLRAPRARLWHWQFALLACLALPLLRPWKQTVITAADSVTAVTVVRSVHAPAQHTVSLAEALLWLLVAGILLRGGWLAAGFWRLRQYRRNSRWLGFRDGASLLLCDGIRSPVTFGVLRPVVLLPTGFPELDGQVQEAILCHELLHVRRRDWLFTVAEELIRTALWFHPAIWWVLGEIGLAREQEVDRQVVERTRSREEYVDALLAIAGARPQLDLAPAPLFLRKRHLKHRVVSILQEVRMSQTRLISSLAAAAGILAAACWLITTTLPLAAAPQIVADAPGVSVDIGSAALVHRTPVDYPTPARNQRVQGTVVVQAQIDGQGTVTDAQVLSGPQELRRAALQSVLDWHFANDGASRTRQVAISFQAPAQDSIAVSAPAPPPPARATGAPIKIRNVVVTGLSDSARAELLARLPVREGDIITLEKLDALKAAVSTFDSHLTIRLGSGPSGAAAGRGGLDAAAAGPREMTLEIAVAQSTPAPQIRVGGEVQSTKLISKATPAYPPLAKEARLQGTVKLNALIGKDGAVKDLTVISGHPLLVPSALEAVKQWVYQPTMLNGAPVEVSTEVDVSYTLVQ